MNVQQLSVFMENKPGHLQNILKILADNDINIITLTIAETADFGILRLIVNNTEQAREALKKQQIVSSITDVLAIELDDSPGSLYRAIDIFARHSINIEYMYAFTEKRKEKAVMIFRFDDIEAAKTAITKENYTIVSSNDIIGG